MIASHADGPRRPVVLVVAKPFSPQEMLARVRAKVRRAAVDSSLQPLTRLPGNIAIEHDVRRRFEACEAWAVIYADLDNFKAFNGADGFVRGDDFIVVTVPDRAEALARTIAADFDGLVLRLYDPVDRERGWIASKDRRGAAMKFPVMSLSLAVVTDSKRITSYQHIGEVAAELKSFAKRQPGSYVASDKRR